MSHLALQRVAVRMLFDPAFADRVYAGHLPPGIDERERSWLTAPDRRSWRHDPLRRTRALAALLEEFPTSAALLPRSLDPFFSSDLFHRALQDGSSLALSFGEWLRTLAEPPALSALAALEGEVARLRRTLPRPAGRGLRLSHRAALIEAPLGTAALHAELTRRLGPDPVRALAEGGVDRTAFPPLDASRAETLLLLVGRPKPGAGLPGCTVEKPPEALAALLSFSKEPKDREALAAEASRLGAEPSEAAGLLEDLAAEGLLEPA